MDIQKNRHNPEFRALHIATCKDLKLYKITDNSDLNYLKSLPHNIKTKFLMPNLTKDEYKRWDEMIEYAVDNALCPGNTTYIETNNNKICGIITFREGKTTILDCICTWPTEFGKKVKLAGQTLFYQLFKDFESSKGKKIKLDAITNGPYNTIEKYEKLGFKTTSNVHPTKVEMETCSSIVKDKLTELRKIVHYQPAEPDKINLFYEIET